MNPFFQRALFIFQYSLPILGAKAKNFMNIAKNLGNVSLIFFIFPMTAPKPTWGSLLSAYRAAVYTQSHTSNMLSITQINEKSLAKSEDNPFSQRNNKSFSISHEKFDENQMPANIYCEPFISSDINKVFKLVNEEALLLNEQVSEPSLRPIGKLSQSSQSQQQIKSEDLVVTKKNPKPIEPREPDPDECCGSGCMPCVFDVYSEKMDKYKEELEKWQKENGIDF